MKIINKLKYNVFCWWSDICPEHLQPMFNKGTICLTCSNERVSEKSIYEQRQEVVSRNLKIAAKLRDNF